jgi:hypothetical protein
MEITITQEDIENGQPHEPESCPLALALKRELINYRVRVQSDYIHFWPYYDQKINFGQYIIHTPKLAQDFISYFDRFEEGKITTLNIPVPFMLINNKWRYTLNLIKSKFKGDKNRKTIRLDN